MSESIINIAGNQIVLPDEDVLIVYSILKSKGALFSEYSGNIDRVLEPMDQNHILTISPAPKKLKETVAAAKAIGASYHDFIKNKS